MTKNIGLLLLGIWLIIYGLAYFLKVDGVGIVLAVLAIVAGIFILIGR
jgi:hypothetical protein